MNQTILMIDPKTDSFMVAIKSQLVSMKHK
jgi:hypothetical protein